MEEKLRHTLLEIAAFYDMRKVGDQGPLGFRRSTDLLTLFNCVCQLESEGVIKLDELRFLDLGCADGRVNVFMSYICEISVGIELDDWTLAEYFPLVQELKKRLLERELLLPKDNIYLFPGDSLNEQVENNVRLKTGLGFEDFDIFYTYLVMHEEFSKLIINRAKKGAQFWVYGISNIMPKYKGLENITQNGPIQGILAVYQKV